MMELFAGGWLRVVVLVGCMAGFALSGAHADSFFNSDGLLHAKDLKLVEVSAAKNAATLRIQPYVNQRSEQDARLLGSFNTRIRGLTGHQLRLNRDVAVIATEQMKQQFSNAGFAVLADDAVAKFELTGGVKTLTLDSKDRDEITIVLATSLIEVATGKVLWQAEVSQKNSRFGGVAGNDRDDIVNFLYRELAVVNGKTVSAVNSLLMASYPALFNLTPGTKTIDGVKVLSAPLAMPVPAALDAATSTGTLVLSSTPSRAKIYVDDIYYGMSPQRLALAAGVHTVMAKLPLYQAETEKVLVRKGEVTELEFSLSK